MHRSRLSLLAIVAASACSTRGDAKGTELLSHDPSLAAGLQDHQKARQLALPDVCGAIAPVVQPTPVAKRGARTLARQAYDAELVGNADSARSLLSRAAQLDATDRSAAYHLGRANETLGDRTGAMTAYCRYIALTPTVTESAEARQRVAALARETQVAAGSVSYAAPTARRIAIAPMRRVTTATRARRVTATHTVDGAVEQASRMASSERTPPPSVEQPASPAPTASRGPSTIQTAGIGAIAGAIMGAATGHSVKSAVIGAAAGGVLGTVVGSTMRPASSRSRRG